MIPDILSDPQADIDDLAASVASINGHARTAYQNEYGNWFIRCACSLNTLGWPSIEGAEAAIDRMHTLKARRKAGIR